MIGSEIFMNSIISGANNIYKNRIHVNELNVFPVPDGDTGTNMSMTILEVAKKFENIKPESVTLSEAANILSYISLRNARGNSGVILSLILKGFKDAFKNIEKASPKDFIKALELGTKNAYEAVSKPTEGTILTVVRYSYEEGCAAIKESGNEPNNMNKIWERVCSGAKKALFNTPELLPILKKSGVVDAGGKGLCLILDGMMSFFKNGVIVNRKDSEEVEKNKFEKIVSNFDQVINFTYCTELIIEKSLKISSLNIDKYKENLKKIGDCVVLVEDDEIIKVHVHTNKPHEVMESALNIGNMLNVKIENMEEQRKKSLEMSSAKMTHEIKSSPEYKIAKPEKTFGILAVVSGKGLIEIFKNLGVDEVVEGGQTLNPSAGEIASAAQSIPAENIFILPNNQNIMLSSKQAKEFVKDRKLIVMPSKTIPQGISACMAFDENTTKTQNINFMTQAINSVKTGIVTYAEKDAEFNNLKIKKNDIIALNCDRFVLTGNDSYDIVVKLVDLMITKKSEFVTLIYGEKIVADNLKSVERKILDKHPKIQLQIFYGGSEIYHFIVSVE
ncbi:MAG: DAK2 domain-containing protein [Candidatus Improbicoccus pseudotrichonymphae]|uniref:DAK2 domain-containing protein n=1 Tax=Candidatus Improbicoccus pseudotrichonymphae TaxID=3033792 RepID=A0AA48I378_9FIRM|nr:MAG: DAK2 domain-containing protein [Candidatus Improbicoccus pseudotrichonymphae]